MRWIKQKLYRVLGIVSPSGEYPQRRVRTEPCPPDCEESCCGPLVVSSYMYRPEKVHAPLTMAGPLDQEDVSLPLCGRCRLSLAPYPTETITSPVKRGEASC